MHVVGFAGYSGSGKTTLVEQLIAELRNAGLRVAVIKHAHHAFEIDHAGKDSYRHRQAGAHEVLIASSKRQALIREFAQPVQHNVHALIAQLDASTDWVLVEGFKQSDLLKLEIWRAGATDRPALYPEDDFIVAIATDSPTQLPQATQRPVLDLNHASGVATWLQGNSARFAYQAEHYHAA